MRGLARQYNGTYASEWQILNRQEENGNVRLYLAAERASVTVLSQSTTAPIGPCTDHKEKNSSGKVENGEAVSA
jgi:hypothetical protein